MKTGLLFLCCVLALLAGCGADETAEEGFALGAFPPVLSDADYHQPSWTRDDCMTCHETGKEDSPVVEHASSLPEEAKQAKCRACHVLVPGFVPEDYVPGTKTAG